MNDYAASLVSLAESQLGTREKPRGSNRGIQVDEYIRASGLDPENGSYPWCMAFVYWLHRQAAQSFGKSTECPRTAGVARCWILSGRRDLERYDIGAVRRGEVELSPGDVFFRARTSKDAYVVRTGRVRPGHCGLVYRVAPDLRPQTIEGNTNVEGSREGDGVYQRELDLADPRLIGIARYGMRE